MNDKKDAVALGLKLKAYIREQTPGQCKIASMGDECPCMLCAVDDLVAALSALRPAEPHIPHERVRKWLYMATHPHAAGHLCDYRKELEAIANSLQAYLDAKPITPPDLGR